MYQVFNMGCRLEYLPRRRSDALIQAAARIGIDAWITGRVEAPAKKNCIKTRQETIVY